MKRENEIFRRRLFDAAFIHGNALRRNDCIALVQIASPNGLLTVEKSASMAKNRIKLTNLEHRMKVIMKNAGLQNIKGGLHIFRKTFATQMYERGARVEEIAAYIGNLESTTRKYYIAIRKRWWQQIRPGIPRASC